MDFISQNIFLITLAVVSGLGLILPLLRDARDHATQVTPAQAVMLMNRQNAVLVDVRDAAEFSAERIEGSRSIPASDLSSRVKEIEKFKSKPVILTCASGSRSARAVSTLKKAGFEQVFNLAGGIKAWKDAGQPISSGVKA
jgi:rhodanese-related sulfurtransferase